MACSNYRLARDVEFEVIDGRRRYGNGRLLPAGPLREPPERRRNAISASSTAAVPAKSRRVSANGLMQLRAGDVQPMQGGRPRQLSSFAGQRVHAVAGIGYPERFFAMLRANDIAVVPHAFARPPSLTPPTTSGSAATCRC
jgi:tetraacyldisaccharide 4'-kinase